MNGKLKNTLHTRIQTFIRFVMINFGSIFSQDTKYQRYLVYFLAFYIICFIIFDLLRLWGFGYYIDDIGIYHQVIWNTANGNWFQTSVPYPYRADGNWLGFHFSVLPIFFAVPFYMLFPHVETMTFIHVSLVASTAIIIYKICRQFEISEKISFFWSIIFLINPITVYHALFSFQETSFAVPLMTLAIYYVICRKFRLLLITSFLLILTKEHHGITVFGLGLLWWWYNKSRREALILCTMGFVAAILVILVIIPHFSPYHEHFLFSKQPVSESYNRYQWFKYPLSVIIDALPQLIFHWKNTYLVFVLLLTFLFLPVRSRGILFFLPVMGDFMAIILSNSLIPKSLYFYYSAPFIPPLLIATIYFLKLKPMGSKTIKLLFVLLFLINIICTILAFEVPYKKLNFISEYPMSWSVGKDFREAISKIPDNKSLMADQPIGSLISNRKIIYSANDPGSPHAEYAMMNIDPISLSPSSILESKLSLIYTQALATSAKWVLVYWKYPYAVFADAGQNQPPVSEDIKKDLIREIEKGFILNESVNNPNKTKPQPDYTVIKNSNNF